MKATIKVLLVSFLVLGFVACDDDDEVIYIFTNDEVVENVINDCLEESSYGLEKQVEIASEVANESIYNMAENYTGSKKHHYSGIYGYYDYTENYTAIQNGSEIELESAATGEYQTYYIFSEDDIENDWVLSNIDSESEIYNLAGESNRDGYQYSKVYKDSFSSEIVLSFDKLEVNRVTNEIKSGNITFTYKGESSYGEVYTSSGTIKYSDYDKEINYDE